LITGGGSGIGLACARALASDGAVVTLMGRNRDKLDAAAETIPGARVHAGDVSVEADVAAAVATAADGGPLTIAVANAGTGGIAPLTATTDEEWQRVMDTSLNGVFYTFKHAALAAAKAGGGALCAVSSIAGIRTHRFMHAYCVAKAGVDMLVRTSADELGPAGVRVNSVLPGLVDTELAQGLFATEEVHQDYLACMPLARTGEVDDIAAAVRFLCGPESSWITGVNLSVDGGHHLRRGPNYDVFARMGFADALEAARLENK
jgi:NAD(P)-dependent dehydrogenase (short-subunit alcohol dehydrogenase family)